MLKCNEKFLIIYDFWSYMIYFYYNTALLASQNLKNRTWDINLTLTMFCHLFHKANLLLVCLNFIEKINDNFFVYFFIQNSKLFVYSFYCIHLLPTLFYSSQANLCACTRISMLARWQQKTSMRFVSFVQFSFLNID